VIVVAGFNTSIDRFLEVDTLEVGGLTRAERAVAQPGGKGLHVALTAAALGEHAELVGIIDSRHRPWFSGFLEERGVVFHGVAVQGEIRTCLAIQDGRGSLTEILEPGPGVSEGVRDELRSRFLERAEQASVAVLSGSLPPGFEDATYRDVLTRLKGRPVRSLLDASGAALRQGVEACPFLVKPNRAEAEALTGVPIRDDDSAVRAAQILGEKSPVVILSLAGAGAAVAWEGRLAWVSAPIRAVVNAVGSGDCLLGGVAVGLARGLEPEAILRLGVACGTANTLSPHPGIVQASDVLDLHPKVVVRWLS
jgi:1-phosphofructokinase family hexose kinase